MNFDFLEVIEIYYAIKKETAKEATDSESTISYRETKLKILMPLLDKLQQEITTYKIKEN